MRVIQISVVNTGEQSSPLSGLLALKEGQFALCSHGNKTKALAGGAVDFALRRPVFMDQIKCEFVDTPIRGSACRDNYLSLFHFYAEGARCILGSDDAEGVRSVCFLRGHRYLYRDDLMKCLVEMQVPGLDLRCGPEVLHEDCTYDDAMVILHRDVSKDGSFVNSILEDVRPLLDVASRLHSWIIPISTEELLEQYDEMKAFSASRIMLGVACGESTTRLCLVGSQESDATVSCYDSFSQGRLGWYNTKVRAMRPAGVRCRDCSIALQYIVRGGDEAEL
jgi:hypothetical protein